MVAGGDVESKRRRIRLSVCEEEVTIHVLAERNVICFHLHLA